MDKYVGKWKITRCIPLTQCESVSSSLERVEFELTASGDVEWKAPPCARDLPLFLCNKYEFIQGSSSWDSPILRFGFYDSHIIEVKASCCSTPVSGRQQIDQSIRHSLLMLTYESLCILQCERLIPSENDILVKNATFSLIPALANGHFSDLTVFGGSAGSEFRVHRCILESVAPGIPWDSLFTHAGVPSDVLSAALHFVYSESLPAGLLEETARRCVALTGPDGPGPLAALTGLRSLCLAYLRNLSIQSKLERICEVVEGSSERVAACFADAPLSLAASACGGGDEEEDDDDYGGGGEQRAAGVFSSASDLLAAHPGKFVDGVKTILKETAITTIHMFYFCDVLCREKRNLGFEELGNGVRYAQRLLPTVLRNFRLCCQNLAFALSPLSMAKKLEISSYIVPEFEFSLRTLTSILEEVHSVLQKVIQSWESRVNSHHRDTPAHHDVETMEEGEGEGEGGFGAEAKALGGATAAPAGLSQGVHHGQAQSQPRPLPADLGSFQSFLGNSMHKTLHMQELMRIRDACDKVTCMTLYFMTKKEHYLRLCVADKVRCVVSSLEELLQEIPWFLERLGDLIQFAETECDSVRYNFCFHLAVEKFAFILANFRDHKSGIQSLMSQLASLVQREEFYAALVELDLLDSRLAAGTGTAAIASSVLSSSLSCGDGDVPGIATSSAHPPLRRPPPRRLLQPNSSAAASSSSSSSTGASCSALVAEQRPLDLVSSLCRPPSRGQSNSAVRMRKLFESGLHADMEFHLVSAGPIVPVPLGMSMMEEEEHEDKEVRGCSEARVDSVENAVSATMMDFHRAEEDKDETEAEDKEEEETELPPKAVATALHLSSSSGSGPKVVKVRAHRVIVASRCDWFRRALTSGMQEDLLRRIVIHDTAPPVFRAFLEYLYSGTLTLDEEEGEGGGEWDNSVSSLHAAAGSSGKSGWGCDQWAELLLVSDRYAVTALSAACETILRRFIGHDTALFLLSIADQCNAHTLRTHCLNHVSSNPGVRDSEDFMKLRPDLRAEVEEAVVSWLGAGRCSVSSHRAASGAYYRFSSKRSGGGGGGEFYYLDGRGGAGRQSTGLEAMTQRMSVSGSASGHRRSRRSSKRMSRREKEDADPLETVPLVLDDRGDCADDELSGDDDLVGSSLGHSRQGRQQQQEEGFEHRMESCIAQLRSIVGEDASRECLREVLLAADFDLNRALNFFFTLDNMR